MKIIVVTPRSDAQTSLKSALKQTERNLRGGRTTLYRQKEGRLKHEKYRGWIDYDIAPGGILVATVKSRVPEMEWQLLESFVGYMTRHLRHLIESVHITYRD